MSGTDSSLFATGIYGVVKTVSIILFLLFVADSLGRRKSLLWTSPMLFVVLFIIGIYGRVQPPVTGQPVSSVATRPWHDLVLTPASRSPHLDMLPSPAFTSGHRM
jgi:hypothetical protein